MFFGLIGGILSLNIGTCESKSPSKYNSPISCFELYSLSFPGLWEVGVTFPILIINFSSLTSMGLVKMLIVFKFLVSAISNVGLIINDPSGLFFFEGEIPPSEQKLNSMFRWLKCFW